MASQCRTSQRSGVTLSYFLRLHSSLAAGSRTDIGQSRRPLGASTSRLLQRSTCDVTKTATVEKKKREAAFQKTKMTEAATEQLTSVSSCLSHFCGEFPSKLVVICNQFRL